MARQKKWLQGRYIPTNGEKYVGRQSPKYRSSWELLFMKVLDNNPAVLKWGSEVIKIPYIDPITGKRKMYVPDFIVVYQDADNKGHAEVIEIKPLKETVMERAGRSAANRMAVVINKAKWQAAQAYCRANGLQFKVYTENQLFAQKLKKRK